MNRNDPIRIEDCFVAPSFYSKKNNIHEYNDIVNSIIESNDENQYIFTGSAGSGKSVFLKSLYKDFVNQKLDYIPLFVEFRYLDSNYISDNGFINGVIKYIDENKNIPKTLFDKLIKEGKILFIFDGFDDLSNDIKFHVDADINELAARYNKCKIIVTSRPSDDFVSWGLFKEFKLMPFTIDKVEEFINKVKFDSERKEDFIKLLNENFYIENKEFLSNPLLASMMLLTFDNHGEIPRQRHIFYRKCFDVLTREHDNSKGRYTRGLYSKVNISQIESLFMYFCASSYIERKFNFDYPELQEHIKNVLKFVNIKEDVSNIIRDFQESISILVKDGPIYEFAHRSFQEYFYAKFATIDRNIPLNKKINKVSDNLFFDDIMMIIFEMDKNYFEEYYLYPIVKSVCEKIRNADPDSNPAKIVSQVFTKIAAKKIDSENMKTLFMYEKNESAKIYNLLSVIYSDDIGLETSIFEKMGDNIQSIIDNGGEIKINHSNNDKLLKSGVNEVARHIKDLFLGAEKILEHDIELRKENLSSIFG